MVLQKKCTRIDILWKCSKYFYHIIKIYKGGCMSSFINCSTDSLFINCVRKDIFTLDERLSGFINVISLILCQVWSSVHVKNFHCQKFDCQLFDLRNWSVFLEFLRYNFFDRTHLTWFFRSRDFSRRPYQTSANQKLFGDFCPPPFNR